MRALMPSQMAMLAAAAALAGGCDIKIDAINAPAIPAVPRPKSRRESAVYWLRKARERDVDGWSQIAAYIDHLEEIVVLQQTELTKLNGIAP